MTIGRAPSDMTALFATTSSLPVEAREQLVDVLNLRLAAAVDLYTQAQQAHWNVKGMMFAELHALFEQIAARVQAHADQLAEQVSALGGTALGTARLAVRASRLPEYPLSAVTGRQHIEALSERVALYGESLREAIARARELDDPVTEDLVTGLARDASMLLWMLEAHVQDVH